MENIEEYYSRFISEPSSERQAQIIQEMKNKAVAILSAVNLLRLYRIARLSNEQIQIFKELNSETFRVKLKRTKEFFKHIKDIYHISPESDSTLDECRFPSSFAVNNCLEIMAMESFGSEKHYINYFLKTYDSFGLQEFTHQYMKIAMFDDRLIPTEIKLAIKYNPHKEFYESFEKYIESHTTNSVEEDKQLIEKIKNCYFAETLTDKSKIFLLLSQELEDVLNKSPFADYSVVSLQYFKVIELELKNRYIKPALKSSNGSFRTINSTLFDKDKLNNEWAFNKAFALGTLHKIFVQTKEWYEQNDLKEGYCYKTLFKLIHENPEYLSYFIDITSQKSLDKYRNPPAHIKPLSKEEADEAKVVFYSFICNLRKLTEDAKELPTKVVI